MLSDIVKATVGSLSIVECVLAPKACEKADECEFRLIYLLITHCIYQVFGKYTLADLDNGELLATVSRELEIAIGDSAQSGVQSPLTPELIPKRFCED
jgi:DNA-binding IscR family transcriptional regulator